MRPVGELATKQKVYLSVDVLAIAGDNLRNMVSEGVRYEYPAENNAS